ncbi:MAG TPA: histidine kinase [Bryobacteraceae bacterium]|nr:histidine kinase [Bryobacteraceae bacterium]
MARLANPTGSAEDHADPLLSCRELQRLALMQHRASRNYFRLLEADRGLRARARGVPKTVGTILADALDAERQRLGRELHTGVGQALAGIHLHLNLLETALPDPPEPVRRSLTQIAALAGAALEQVRGVSRRLYVPDWQARPLADALRSLWETSGICAKFEATLDLHELSAEPPPEVRRAVYLTAQEGISNAIQHADARRARLSLREEGSRIVLEVSDDGSGFRAPAQPAPAGIGLRSIHDLASQLGGNLQVESTSEGTKLSISFPVIHE